MKSFLVCCIITLSVAFYIETVRAKLDFDCLKVRFFDLDLNSQYFSKRFSFSTLRILLKMFWKMSTKFHTNLWVEQTPERIATNGSDLWDEKHFKANKIVCIDQIVWNVCDWTLNYFKNFSACKRNVMKYQGDGISTILNEVPQLFVSSPQRIIVFILLS